MAKKKAQQKKSPAQKASRAKAPKTPKQKVQKKKKPISNDPSSQFQELSSQSEILEEELNQLKPNHKPKFSEEADQRAREEGSQLGSDGGDEDDDDSDQDDSDDDEEESSSVTPVKPENFAVKQMQFRERRGTKMNYLMTRKKEEEEDPFWAEHKGYFGDLNMEDDEDEEDYVEDSEGKDEFDSDFGDTESQHDEQQEQDDKKMVDELDDDVKKQKRKKAELMKKINAYKQKPSKPQHHKQDQSKQKTKAKTSKKQGVTKTQQKTEPSQKKEKANKKMSEEIGSRYIHQAFTQEQLLGEAAHTEYYNWLSLKKLISIETEKKDFTRKVKHVDGSKVVYRSRLNQNGVAQTTYELDGVAVENIKHLTDFWNAGC